MVMVDIRESGKTVNTTARVCLSEKFKRKEKSEKFHTWVNGTEEICMDLEHSSGLVATAMKVNGLTIDAVESERLLDKMVCLNKLVTGRKVCSRAVKTDYHYL